MAAAQLNVGFAATQLIQGIWLLAIPAMGQLDTQAGVPSADAAPVFVVTVNEVNAVPAAGEEHVGANTREVAAGTPSGTATQPTPLTK